MNLLEPTDINELINRYNELTDWLYDHLLAYLPLFEEKLRERNILSVRIHNYYHDNNYKII